MRIFVAGAVTAGVWGLAAAGLAAEAEPVLERCLVSPVDEAKVPAREAGVLVELLVREGDTVSRDEVIARIDDDQPQMEKRKAAAEHAQADAKAKSDVDKRFAEKSEEVAEKAWERAENAHKVVRDSVPEVERDKLRLEWEKTKLQIEQADLERRLTSLASDSKLVEVDAAENGIQRRLIRAPIDGVVEELMKHRGEWLQPGDSLAHVQRKDTLRVEGLVDSEKWGRAAVRDRPVTIDAALESGRRERLTGRIVFVSEKLEGGGDYRILAEVQNRKDPESGEWILSPGQLVTMVVHSSRPKLDPVRK